MASGSITVNSPTKTVATYIGWSSSSNGSAANSSNVTATVYFRKTNGYTTRGTFAGTLKIDGTSYSISRYGTWAGSYIAIGSKSKTVAHNADGKKSITISTTYSNSGTDQAGTYSGSGTAVLDTIPRASSISSSASWTAGEPLTVSISRSATSFTHTVSVKVGSTVVASASGVGTSVTFSDAGFHKAVFTALAQQSSEAASVTVTTYSGSTSVGSKSVSGTVAAPAACTLTCSDEAAIGSSQDITISGGGGLVYSLKYSFRGEEGYIIGDESSGAAAEAYKWDIDDSFYDLITDAAGDICTLTLTAYYDAGDGSAHIQVGSPVEKLFDMIVTDSDPVFENFTFSDTDPVTEALTGSDSIFIQGYSDVRAFVKTSEKAQALNGAHITEYVLRAGSRTSSAAYSDDEDVSVSITDVTSGEMTMTAYDSRGFYAEVSREAVLKEYRPPAIRAMSLERLNGVDVQTRLRVDLYIWDESFGALENGIMSCTYRYRKAAGEDSWVNGMTSLDASDFVFIEDEGIYRMEKLILGDDEGGFALAGSYEVEVTAEDRLESTAMTASIDSGYPGIYLKREDGDSGEVGYQVGINCVPDPELGSGLHVHGKDITLNGSSVFMSAPVGAVTGWFGEDAPAGWLLLNGQAVSRSAYPALFEILGTTYGEGDGTDTFNLPDLRGRMPVGKTDDAQDDFSKLGGTGGEKTHILTTAEMPAHKHSVTGTAASGGAHTHKMAGIATRKAGSWNGCVASAGCSDTAWTSARSAGAHTHSVSGTAASAGTGNAHNNMPPYIVMNYIIKAG